MLELEPPAMDLVLVIYTRSTTLAITGGCKTLDGETLQAFRIVIPLREGGGTFYFWYLRNPRERKNPSLKEMSSAE